MKIDEYVIAYLEHLSGIGFEICFISNSSIKQEYRNLLLEKVKHCNIYERENKGADFGAWKWALEQGMIPDDLDYLLLTNDSLYGPFFPLRPIVENMQLEQGVDFWGLTDSYAGEWHLQSYFMLFPKRVFTSEAFKKIFQQDFSQLGKLEIIKKGELELTKSLLDAGFKGSAYVSYDHLSPGFDKGKAKNPTHFFWDQLIEKFKFPFVKKELILQNPENIQNTDRLFTLIKESSSYPIQNIKRSISNYLASFNTSNTFQDKISVLCHLYYPGSIYYFLTRIAALKSTQTQFIINLSIPLYHNGFFREMLQTHFPEAIVLYTPNQGRDIGGKLAALDVLIRLGIQTDYSLIIHDKLSPHSATGVEWRNKLLRITDSKELSKVFRRFREDREAGVITSKELIKNEFDYDRERFTCTSDKQIWNYIKKYNLRLSDYNFAAGTIFWIRTEILQNFFSCYSPLSVRKEFEKGNSLDFDNGTNIHAWERLFSFIAHSQGFKTVGI